MDQLPPTPQAAASIAADTVYPGMYRVRYADDFAVRHVEP
jgi:hypothetical protein